MLHGHVHVYCIHVRKLGWDTYYKVVHVYNLYMTTS